MPGYDSLIDILHISFCLSILHIITAHVRNGLPYRKGLRLAKHNDWQLSKVKKQIWEKGSPYLPPEEISTYFTMEHWFWAELIDLVGHDAGHILLAVGCSVQWLCMYDVPVFSVFDGTATYWGIYLRSGLRSGRRKNLHLRSDYDSATGEQPLGLCWSIACCCGYSECSVLVVRTSYGWIQGVLWLGWSEWGFGYGPSSRLVPYLAYCQ